MLQNGSQEEVAILGEPNLTSFIKTRNKNLDKAICIYAVFYHT